MVPKDANRVELISGGNIIKQGEEVTLIFQFRDESGIIVDLSDVNVKIILTNSREQVLEKMAEVVGNTVKVTFTKYGIHTNYGQLRMEFQIITQDGKTRKFPSDGFQIIKITPSLHDINLSKIPFVTVETLKSEIQSTSNQEVTEIEKEAITLEQTASNLENTAARMVEKTNADEAKQLASTAKQVAEQSQASSRTALETSQQADINAKKALQQSSEAKTNSTQAKADSAEALTKANGSILQSQNTQAEVNKLVVQAGESSSQVLQALTNASGKTFDTLKEVLDDKDGKIEVLSSSNVYLESFPRLAGETNDSPRIKRAIQSINTNKGKIIAAAKTYDISEMINLPPKVAFVGAGRSKTFIRPTFTSGNVFGSTSYKQKTRISDLTIKPDSYQYKLIGVNFTHFQYGTVERVDIYRCGVGFDFDGTVGCYYNKVKESRTVSCAYGIRTKRGTGSSRPNANEVNDVIILSPIIGVFHSSGNSNILRKIQIESLESVAPHPMVDPDGVTVTASDRWMLKITGGTGSRFEKLRAEFDGNLVSLSSTYGNFLKDFYCNFNGEKGTFIELEEAPTNPWQTNNLMDIELGSSLPTLRHSYYFRYSRLGQKFQLPPQISMTPRDTVGAPTTGEKGYIRMDANADLWVATAADSFKKVFYDAIASSTVRGPVKYHKASITLSDLSVPAKGYQSFNISTGGLQANDNVNVSTNIQVPDGLIVSPPYVDYMTFNTKIRVYNITDNSITLPAGTWTAAYVRP